MYPLQSTNNTVSLLGPWSCSEEQTCCWMEGPSEWWRELKDADIQSWDTAIVARALGPHKSLRSVSVGADSPVNVLPWPNSHPVFFSGPSHCNLSHPPIQPCNLAGRFRGCYFYWIPNNMAVIALKCRRRGLVAVLRLVPQWGPLRLRARTEAMQVTAGEAQGQKQGNNNHHL